jgi:transcriptional regulator with XRE-family HTH domain
MTVVYGGMRVYGRFFTLLWVQLGTVAPLQAKFASVIRSMRTKALLSQEELAHKAGLHPTYISLLENCKRMPSLLVVQKIAAALDVTMKELVGEVESAEDPNQLPRKTRSRPH